MPFFLERNKKKGDDRRGEVVILGGWGLFYLLT